MYTKEKRKKIAELWRGRLDDWAASGLTITQWCRDREIPYRQFVYWRHRLDDAKPPSGNDHFIELSQESCSPIVIEVNGAKFHVSSDFDPQTLLQCLQLVRSIPC